MALTDPSNTIFQKAVAFVNQTSKHLFLTGKAGTGKTTFLKYIREHGFKKMAVVAPTGVAAINAGGVTIHSFFQLPLGPYIPSLKNNWEVFDGRVNNQHSLFKNLRLGSSKRDLMKELELLIIDEVSMVRADMLDEVDVILRHVRKQPSLPFGGVQMLYIGDLFQLPPVVKNDEWQILREHYKSPFFFDAQVLQQVPPVYIELKKIYRQSDHEFISILNNLRNNQCTADDLEQLHQYYKPQFFPAKEENYITLTSHNDKADAINRNELKKLPGKLHSYKAEITGEFYERTFPADEVLYLKEGAQVMFIKNDKGEIRRYYNGKIGLIKQIEAEKILVSFPNEAEELELEKETWQNIKYNYNKEKDKIDEEELGTFTQYPIRLAWAITIHKSQGLTFDKAVIDAGASFAPGQVYVALSRLTKMEGLVLHSRIHSSCISTDARVIEFVKGEWTEEDLQQTLEEEQQLFVKNSLLKGFGWQKVLESLLQHVEELQERELPKKETCLQWAQTALSQTTDLHEVAVKFIRQLEQLYLASGEGYQQLHSRTKAAVDYFSKSIDESLIASVDEHFEAIKKEKKVKGYLKELVEIK
ncbi:MAG TPA: AAA family ATPase, partial [Flavisolibacter sp.]|nr:AAA family ATPase [Flavisolibacter sp.]